MATTTTGDRGVSAVTPAQSPAVVKPFNAGSPNPPAGGNESSEQRTGQAGSSAAMNFPHILSKDLGSDDAGNNATHTVAYNFGTRPEEASQQHASLSDLISLDDLASYSSVYFSTLGTIGDFIDARIYAQRCKKHYVDNGSTTDSTSFVFGAIAASMAALGSFLSSIKHPHEADLVQYAKAILDDPAYLRKPDVQFIIAYSLRVFYLRATTRPSNAWIASCTGLHLCEAVGLHEEESIKKIAAAAGAAQLGLDEDRLRRIFWVPWAGNAILSYEYDRSSVYLRTITTQEIMPIAGSVADQFVHMAQIIPGPNSPFELTAKPRTQTEDLFERLKALHAIELADPFLLITRADIAFCFYRRAYQLKMGIPDEFAQIVIDIGSTAVDAGVQLSKVAFFWNIIGSIFHFTCILLAIDTPQAATHISSAFKGLEALVTAADTKHTREALSMTRKLLDLHLGRKRKELAQLEPIQASYQPSQSPPDLPDPGNMINMPEFGYGIDWDQFILEPYLPMFNTDVQL
ncbi:hypothetical protein PRZ48_015274 [Zasmidium cellare]|uniref:Transcription factor domain-containing protein n=1 Tax=Zasmidium cellare TaxID=395010 RepID=A0ABR0DWM8_ZASCE|nr:hypothetical protein PRZ48_015274 [Zasmidium cellare]